MSTPTNPANHDADERTDPAAAEEMATGASSQCAETITIARGFGMDCAQSKRSASHCGSSRVGGAPWLTNSDGMGPSAGSQRRWARVTGRARTSRSSYAPAGVG